MSATESVRTSGVLVTDHAPLARVVDIDVVVADGDVGDDLQLLRRVDGRGVELVVAASTTTASAPRRRSRSCPGDSAVASACRSTVPADSSVEMTDDGSFRVTRIRGIAQCP